MNVLFQNKLEETESERDKLMENWTNSESEIDKVRTDHQMELDDINTQRVQVYLYKIV